MKKINNIPVINYNQYLFWLLCVLFVSFSTGCNKLVEVDGPKTNVSSQNVYKNDATAIGVLTSLYASIANGDLFELTHITGLSSDELVKFAGTGDANKWMIYHNALESSINMNFWQKNYKGLFIVNAAIEGIAAATELTPITKQQLMGEALFMRAYYYFYLVNLYGGVPLVLTSDYRYNSLVVRSSKEQVYQQIIKDLKEAKDLLSSSYLKADGLAPYPGGSEERVRPTRWAAMALLARVYLYTGDWGNAEVNASGVLENTSLYQIETPDKVFSINNRESIWQVPLTGNVGKVLDAEIFTIMDAGPSEINPYYLSSRLINDFDSGDKRKENWINYVVANGNTYYYPYKYKNKDPLAPVTEYNVVMRLAEQYLIRAESRAQQENISGSIDDIDMIRDRAGLPLIKNVQPDISKEDLLDAILRERRLEFFAECGHRWLDLKRTGKVDEVMTIVTPEKDNGNSWKSYQQWYPVYSEEIRLNPNMIQTAGY